MLRRLLLLFFLLVALIVLGTLLYRHFILPPSVPPIVVTPPLQKPPVLHPKPVEPKPEPPAHIAKMLDSVLRQTTITHAYDPAYVVLKYPGGDVPETTGVCADVIVRAFRANGVDLQKILHEDMQRHFSLYPKKWGMKQPDANIDHRRVYNLMTLFERQGKSLPVTYNTEDYQIGDIVTWDLGNGQGHIGIVTQLRTADGSRPLIGHNIGYGTSVEDVLYAWRIIGHYRYFTPIDGDKPTQTSQIQ